MTQTDRQFYSCSAQVHDTYGVGFHRCSRKAKVYRDGEQYCNQHDPERVAERRAEQSAKSGAERERRSEYYRRRAAEARACEGIPTAALESGVVAEILAACEVGLEFVDHWVGDHSMDCYRFVPRRIASDIRAAIARAKGETQ